MVRARFNKHNNQNERMIRMLKKFKKSKSFIFFVVLLLFCITISACNVVNESLPDSKYEMFYAGMASNDSMGVNEEQ